MNIAEAARAATKEKAYWCRRAWAFITEQPCSAPIKLLPTDSPDCCVVLSVHEKAPRARWEPRAEDLMAEDWELAR